MGLKLQESTFQARTVWPSRGLEIGNRGISSPAKSAHSRLRISRAKQLLKASNVSLERVATACGFYNASHLSSAFLRCVGVRPSAFCDGS